MSEEVFEGELFVRRSDFQLRYCYDGRRDTDLTFLDVSQDILDLIENKREEISRHNEKLFPLCNVKIDFENCKTWLADGNFQENPQQDDFGRNNDLELSTKISAQATINVQLAETDRPYQPNVVAETFQGDLASPVVGPENSFRNPYNFVPTTPRRYPTNHPLGDHIPQSWGRYQPDHYSGVLNIELEVVTPILANDHELTRIINNATKHKIYPKVIQKSPSEPEITVSSLKSSISRWYELATHSRWRKLAQNRPLAKRMAIGQALGTVPFRVEARKDGSLEAVLMTGTCAELPVWEAKQRNGGSMESPRFHLFDETMFAAFVPMYGPFDQLNTFGPQDHGKRVFAALYFVWHPSKKFCHWVTAKIGSELQELADCPSCDDFIETTGLRRLSSNPRCFTFDNNEPLIVEGYLCITNRNIGNKKYERLFFLWSDVELDSADRMLVKNSEGIPTALGQTWLDCISSYRDETVHTKREIWNRNVRGNDVGPAEWISKNIGKTAWSGHIYRDGSKKASRLVSDDFNDRDWMTLEPGTLGYALLNKDSEVERLIPVHLARQTFSHSPATQLDDTLKPAQSLDELSPADRVFGWVAENSKGSSENGLAHKGQIRVRRLKLTSAPASGAIRNFQPPLSLNNLASPKPQQARFYLGSDPVGSPLHPLPSDEIDFSGQQCLRGPKVYPHQNHPASFWSQIQNGRPSNLAGQWQEFIKPQGAGGLKTSQNFTIGQWIEPKTEYRFEIQFTNLSAEELGGLLWLLSVNSESSTERDFHFKYGGSKPFGFGSVKLRLSSATIRTGQELANEFRSLAASQSVAENHSKLILSLIKKYKECLKSFWSQDDQSIEFEELPMIGGLLAAGRGHGSDSPVHYPRLAPANQTENKGYKWFAENDKNWRQSLPAITSSETLRRS